MPEQAPLSHLVPVLKALPDWLAAQGVRGTLIGGVAASFHGRPRFTRDVDALLVLEEAKWAAFMESGARFGFEPRIPDAVAFAARSRVLLARHSSTRINVDLMMAGLPFERQVIARAEPLEVMGLRVLLARPEDLVILKAIAARPRDRDDIDAILAAQPKLDRRRVRRVVRDLATAMDRPDLAADLEVLLARRRGRRSG